MVATNKKRRTKNPSIFIAIPLIFCSVFVVIATAYKIIEAVSPPNHSEAFPKLEIFLAETAIEQVDLNAKAIKYYNNNITFTANDHAIAFDSVELKGHGNSTWLQPKKSYQIKLPEKVSFFNYGKAKKWLLIANSLDRTYLRNKIAHHIGTLLNERFSVGGDFTNLYIDGQYRGLYYLSEKVDINKSRINLKNNLGIVFELDNIHGSIDICNYTNNKNCLIVTDIVNHDDTDNATKNFIESFNQFELALKEHNYSKVSELIDIESFAKYYLLNEFAINPDAYSSSFFFYKDGANDKIHAGPSWDFDYAFGNRTWIIDGIDPASFFAPSNTNILKDYLNISSNASEHLNSISTIVYDLLDFPEFSQKVREIYQSTLSGHGEELLNYIKNQADYIRDAAYRDQARWKLKTDFNEEVNYLLDWVSKRYAHFEETYGASTPTSETNTTIDTPAN